MNNERRKTIAFACGMYFANKKYSNIFDYTRGTFYNLDYSVNDKEISVYDYELKCYLSGSLPSLFDYGISSFVDLKIKGEGVIEVYDFKTGTFLDANCRGENISLFDYKEGKFFEYQLG